MEPIFDNAQFNRNKDVVPNCDILKMGTRLFFMHEKNRSLNYHFYHFGLLFDSNHYEKTDVWRKEVFTPTRDIYGGEIDYEIIVSAQLGKDLNNEYDEQQSDKYDPYYWRIIKAMEYKRPDWAFYMFAGNIQGLFNGNRILEKRLLQYFRLFPEEFIIAHKQRLQYAFNYFDERGYLLVLDKAPELIKIGRGLYDDILATDVV